MDIKPVVNTLVLSGAGSAYDKVTAQSNIRINAFLNPGASAVLMETINGVKTKVGNTYTADANGQAYWNVTNLTPGKHIFSLDDPTLAIPYYLDGSQAASMLTVNVLASATPTVI